MTEIKLKVPEFTKLMREYAKTAPKMKSVVEPSCWRSMKRTLVENKRIIYIHVTNHWIRFFESGDFPGSAWMISNTYGLSDFIEWIFAKQETMLTDLSSAANAISSVSTAVSAINTIDNAKYNSVTIDGTALNTYYTDRTSVIEPIPYSNVVDVSWDSLATISSIQDTYVKKSDCKCCKNEEKKEKKNKRNKESKESEYKFFSFNGVGIQADLFGIAVKNIDNRYVAYDVKTHSIMDVEILNMPCGDFLYKMPVAIKDIKAGDVVIHNRVPMFVVEVHDSTLKVVDIHEGTEKEIYLTKSPFGFNFATKVVSLIDFTGKADASNPFGNMLPFLMMGEGKMDDMLPMMMLMNGGKMDTSNPMMMYFMMKDNGNMKDMLPLMFMSGMANTTSK